MTVINIKKYFLLIVFSAFSQLIFSQNIEFKKVNFKSNKQALRSAKESIEIADQFREKAILKFLNNQDANFESENAFFYYEKAQLFNPNNADLNYKIGSVLLFTNKKELAKQYLDRAISLNKELPDEISFFQAMVFQLEGNYLKALETYQYFRDNAKKKIVSKYNILLEKYIEECSVAPDLLNQKKRVWVDNLDINSEYDDWSPCLSTDGELLIFTSNRKNENGVNEIGGYDQDIYYSNFSDRTFSNISSLKELNTLDDDVAVGLSYDGQRLLLYKEEDGNTDVFESKLDGANWSEARRKMGKKMKGGNTDKNETFASFDPPDVKVYYITDGGYSGNKDIYFSGVMNKERNIWGNGQSAGVVNSKFQEGSVYIHPDGRTMYFSSKGHNSLGGYDIFVSYVDELGHWGEPINLGHPINTAYDDLFYSPTASGRHAYISSNRPGGKGGLDIYKITYFGVEKPMSSDSEDQLISSIAHPVSDNKVAVPITIDEKSLTVFKGRIIDGITNKPIEAKIDITINTTGEIYTSVYSNSVTGKFLLSLPSGDNYGISVSAEDYLFHSENFDLPSLDRFNVVEKDIELKNIKVGNNITLRNVFFNTAKWNIKTDSYTELDKLAELMLATISLKIQISGHTDNVGSESFNQLLSRRRADAVVNYLVEKGVDINRLTAKGYGQSKPLASNDTEEGRATNRRTDFEIVAE